MKESLALGILGASLLEAESLLEGISSWESFDVASVRVFGNRGSIGRRLSYGDKRIVVEESSRSALGACDAVFLTTPPSEGLAQHLAERGVLCIDLVSLRESAGAPLVPWVNGLTLDAPRLLAAPVIFVPDPVVTLCSSALRGFAEEQGIDSLSLTTTESLSGAGKPGLDVLRDETQAFFAAEDLTSRSSALFARSVAFNVMPCDWESRHPTSASQDLAASLLNVLSLRDVGIDVQRLRVPTFVGVGVSVVVGLRRPATLDEARALLDAGLGATVAEGEQCSHREIQGSDVVHAEVRVAASVKHGFALWLVADNLRLQVRNALACVDLVLRNGIMPELRQRRKGSR